MELTTQELSLGTYSDFELLAAKQGNCWCMYYQRPRPIGRGQSQEEVKRLNRRDKGLLIRNRRSHAILVYHGERPVGWCQYGAAEELPRIDAGIGYKKVGRPRRGLKLWRITCFFVDREYRSKGVAKLALHSALESIKSREVESSRHILWCPRRWRSYPNGVGSVPPPCFCENTSHGSLPSGQAGS